MPYAKAMVNHGEAIDKCPPGGIDTVIQLAEKFAIDPEPFIDEMKAKLQQPQLAFIRESECIGCTKCIQACPVDAIIGSAKLMHTIIPDECTGCELCVPACPVDCIDLIPVDKLTYNLELARKRHKAKQARETDTAQQQSLSAQRELNLKSAKSLSKKALIQEALDRRHHRTKY